MKQLSLLSLLLLTSTSAWAYENAGIHAQSGMELIPVIVGIGLMFFFVVHFFLLACYQYLILKNKQVSISTLLKASAFNFLLWGSAGIVISMLRGLPFLDALVRLPFKLLEFYQPTILILVLIIMVITAMPIYTFLFSRKNS